MLKINNPFFFLFTILIIITKSNCFAQAAKTDTVKYAKSYWATAGFGIGSLGFLGMATANAELWHNTAISFSTAGEINKFGADRSDPAQNLSVNTQNLMFGRIFKQKVSFIAVSAGVGVVNAVSYTDSVYLVSQEPGPFGGIYATVKTHQKNEKAINIPILIQSYVVIAEPVGFGVSGYVNLNKLRTTAGLTIDIALGRMTTRDRKTVTSGRHSHPRRPPIFPFLN